MQKSKKTLDTSHVFSSFSSMSFFALRIRPLPSARVAILLGPGPITYEIVIVEHTLHLESFNLKEF